MAARRRAIELGQTTKKRKQQSLTMWMNPKKAKKTRCEEKVVVVTREVASTDADQCAGAYNLVHGPFINRTMLYTKYVIPMSNSEYKKGNDILERVQQDLDCGVQEGRKHVWQLFHDKKQTGWL